MKVIAKWGFAFKGVEYKGGQVFEVEQDVYNEIKNEVAIVQTVIPTLEKAKNTQQKTAVTKEVKAKSVAKKGKK